MAKTKKKTVEAKKPATATKRKSKTFVDALKGKPAKSKPYISREDEAATSPAENETNFKIVMGVVRPPRVRLSGASPYPFKSLPVGGSFMIPAEVIDKANYSTEKEAAKAQAEACGLVANRLSGATRRFTKRNNGYKFTVFTVDNGTSLGFDNDIGVVVQRIE